MTLLGYEYRNCKLKIVVFGLLRNAITKFFLPSFLFLSFLMLLPLAAVAQFPAPSNFGISINYILTDQWDYCENEIVFGPTYCIIFSWNTPDTSGVSAILAGYRLYKEDTIFHTLSDTILEVTGPQIGKFYVTALYENPPGESDSSNIVIIDDLPIATKETQTEGKIEIGFDISQQQLIVKGYANAKTLSVFNLQGVRVLHTEKVPERLNLEGLPSGAYLAVVLDRHGAAWSGKVLVVGN